MNKFDIPVVLFIFKRYEPALRVIEAISKVKPQKLYIIADGPRNKDEEILVNECRKKVEEGINWECEVIRNYAKNNMGIYNRIGLGAKWVFSMEDKAIFLEDDNLPEETFFEFCKQMLEKYYTDNRILWICGTNYLEKYNPENGASYMFTKHLLPCGWASWANKFPKFYDGNLELLDDPYLSRRLRNEYENKSLYRQQLYAFNSTKRKMSLNKPISWDFQMAYSIRINNLYGISPKYNQIRNIGVDSLATHGGTSYNKVMTRRFCGVESFPLEFPLVHPKTVLSDITYEKKISKIILYPLYMRVGIGFLKLLKPIFGVHKYDSITAYLKKKINRK